MVQAFTYGRPVFDALLQLCGPGELTEPFVHVDDRGVWIGEQTGILDWTPLCELMEPGSADPLSEPALPFPFSAAQLAAFMLDGWGWFLRDAVGEWAEGPSNEFLLRLGIRDGKVREVLDEAYRVFREAQSVVGPLDASIQVKAQRLHAECRKAESEADRREAWRERGITEEERSIRRDRARKSTAKIVRQHHEAEAKAKSAHRTWRQAMARQLLPQDLVSGPGRDRTSPVSSSSTNLLGKRPRAYWRVLLSQGVAEVDANGKGKVADAVSWLVEHGNGRVKLTRDRQSIEWRDNQNSWCPVERKTISTALSHARKRPI